MFQKNAFFNHTDPQALADTHVCRSRCYRCHCGGRNDLAARDVGQVGLDAAGTGIVRLLRAYGVEKNLSTLTNRQLITDLEKALCGITQ